jgi:RNA polymerase sigma factor (sigma-70 family)
LALEDALTKLTKLDPRQAQMIELRFFGGFLAACELAESEMGAFLDHACAGDPTLREELESLLKQPRSTTIIGASSEDAAHGKILSPIAHLPPGTYSRQYPRCGGTGGESVAFSPDEIIAAQRYKIQQAIALLPDEQRAALALREMEGLRYEAIAMILAVPIGTVRSRLHCARRQLRELLQEA